MVNVTLLRPLVPSNRLEVVSMYGRAMSPERSRRMPRKKQAWLKSAPVEKTALPLLLCAIALPVRNPLTNAMAAAVPRSRRTGR